MGGNQSSAKVGWVAIILLGSLSAEAVMACQWCVREAVSRCYSCGDLVCEAHQGHGKGSENCLRCETAILAGDYRTDRVSRVSPASKLFKVAWWRPIPAEDYDPPSCYLCQGLARQVCRHCRERYCLEHGSRDGLCRPCERSSLLGLIVLGLILFGCFILAVMQGMTSN